MPGWASCESPECNVRTFPPGLLIRNVRWMNTESDQPRWDVPNHGYSNSQSNQRRDPHTIRRTKHVGDDALLNCGLRRLDDAGRPFSVGLHLRKVTHFHATRL